ncbi:hypothetical protein QFC22_002522 [Naganishia vaughanmartiniae]|uniref:Uncharacterized protein n=1 Tax=Naganishia vaughanmartiniae TaxID=1424756 RepID=A0ACC2X987_9TREE|nr:hypothetical protein QFC22_002522 [Naganishia vaughanmartiniae]
MQAIRRWEAEHNRRTKPKAKKRTYRIPRAAMGDLLQSVRELQMSRASSQYYQRCNREEDWTAAAFKFFRDVKDTLCKKHGLASGVFTQVEDYFNNNWLTEDWRRLWTDIGLPEKGATRDGVLNTDNWIESAFKTFKAIFLGGKKNRRVDRLIAVLLNDYFPYYALWSVEEARPSRELLDLMERGYQLWKGAVFRKHSEKPVRKWIVYHKQQYKQEDGSVVWKDVNHMVTVRPDLTRHCTCRAWLTRGKLCEHMWALSWTQKCGPYVRFQEKVLSSTARLGTSVRGYKLPPPGEVDSLDAKIDADLEEDFQAEAVSVFEDAWLKTKIDLDLLATTYVPADSSHNEADISTDDTISDESPGILSPINQDVSSPVSSLKGSVGIEQNVTLKPPVTPRKPTVPLAPDATVTQSNVFRLRISCRRSLSGSLTPPDPSSPAHKPADEETLVREQEITPSRSSASTTADAKFSRGTLPKLTKKIDPKTRTTIQKKSWTGQKAAITLEPVVEVLGEDHQLHWPPQPRNHAGLLNGDNSCYAIALFQCLLGIPAFNQTLRALSVPRSTRGANYLRDIQALAEEWENASQPFKPDLLRTTQGINGLGLPHGSPQCVGEAFSAFISRSLETREKTLRQTVRDLFLCTYEVDIRCLACQKKRPLPLEETYCANLIVRCSTTKKVYTTEALLKDTVESQSDERSQACDDACASKTDVISRKLQKASPILVLRISRDAERMRQQQLGKKAPASKEIDVQKTLNAQSLTGGAYNHLSYSLFAVVQHMGTGENGHYVADTLHGEWWTRYDGDRDPERVPGPFGRTSTTKLRADGTLAPKWASTLLFYQLRVSHPAGLETTADESKTESVSPTTPPTPSFLLDYNYQSWQKLLRLVKTSNVAQSQFVAALDALQTAPEPSQAMEYKRFCAAPGIAAVGSGQPIAAQDAAVFRHGKMINDNIIFSWGELLTKLTSPKSALIADTHMMKSMESSEGLRRLDKWLDKKKVVLFSYLKPYERMVFAVHLGDDGGGGLHWATGVIDFAKEIVSMYDSLSSPHNRERFFKGVKAFLAHRYARELVQYPDEVIQAPLWRFKPDEVGEEVAA